MSTRLIVGDARDVMATMPDGSVDLVLTSPPFLALRSYLPADHADKHREIGSEPTPAAFIDTLLAITAEWRRVLAPHGSICVELGDTYSDSGGAGGDYTSEGGFHEGQPVFKQARSKEGWPLPKSLTCIPDLYQVALAYGINPLTGAESPAGRWRVRNKRAWCRPNPSPGALGDKVRPATTYMVMACLARDRWFDLDAVRSTVPSPNTHARTARGVESRPSTGKTAEDERRGGNWSTLDTLHLTAGAPPLDWVNISTQAYKGAHYATWPEELCVQPILMMCPEQVCRVCGAPRRRIVGEFTLGSSFTDCGHGDYRPGVVLDPFCGSGTSLQVATRLGRDAIGIDLDGRNEALVRERVGLFLGEVLA